MPRVYRVMKRGDGKPALGASATTLGVRPSTDITPDASGYVHPNSGGMSVSPSLRALPVFLLPRRLQALVPGAAGSNSHSVWRMGEGPFVAGAIAERLQLRPDPQNSSHGFVEPGGGMSLTEYQLALHATQDDWLIDEE
jgi:hypothetical protein